MSSSQTLASCSAFNVALTVFGFFSANSAVNAQTFSGWSFQMSCVLIAVNPMPSAIVRAFQGSPTQNPSILPTFILATIWAGGTTISETSLSGIDAAGRQPVPNPHRVSAGRERHRERQRRPLGARLGGDRRQRLGIGLAIVP